MLSVSFLGLLPWPLPCLLTLPMVISLGIAPGQTDLTVDSSRCLDVSLLKQIVDGWLSLICTVDSGFAHPHLGGSQSHTDAGDHKALLSDPVHASTPPSAHYATHPTQTFFRSNISLGRLVSSCFLLHSFVRSLALENPDCKFGKSRFFFFLSRVSSPSLELLVSVLSRRAALGCGFSRSGRIVVAGFAKWPNCQCTNSPESHFFHR